MTNRALLVVDMGLEGAEAAVSNAAIAVAQARRAAIPVVFTGLDRAPVSA